jgi:hypothetical protein
MPQEITGPLDNSPRAQAERERVLRKFDALKDIHGAENYKTFLTPEEQLVLMNGMADKAIEWHDEKLAKVALAKFMAFTRGKPPTSKQLETLLMEILTVDERISLMGHFALLKREQNLSSRN